MVLFIVFVAPMAGAKEESKGKEAPKAAAPKADPKREERRKLIEEKKAELNGSEWEVVLTASDGKSKGEKDVLKFQNGQVSTKNFSGQGFNPTNYTITIEEGNDMAIWETMQTGSTEGVVFIRGEWKDGTMRGLISQQLEGGKTKDYSFASAGKKSIEPTTPKKEEAQAAQASTETASKEASSQKESSKETTTKESKSKK